MVAYVAGVYYLKSRRPRKPIVLEPEVIRASPVPTAKNPKWLDILIITGVASMFFGYQYWKAPHPDIRVSNSNTQNLPPPSQFVQPTTVSSPKPP